MRGRARREGEMPSPTARAGWLSRREGVCSAAPRAAAGPGSRPRLPGGPQESSPRAATRGRH